MLLLGLLLCYFISFILLLKPTKIICAIQKFAVGFSFSLSYSALLTKTNRIYRIFSAGRRTSRRPKFISPVSQVLICTGLIFFQIIISTVWLIFSPPNIRYYYPTRASNQLVCESAVGFSFIIGLIYPMFLVVICTIYAILTRNIPEAFNESKHIGFTMYTICIIWLAFVPIYASTSANISVRLITTAFSVSLSATVTLICLFAPKMYIIIIRPERNVKQTVSRLIKSVPTTTKTEIADDRLRFSDGAY